jgi:hypothetical protein
LVTPLYNVNKITIVSAKIPNFSGTYLTLKMSIGDDILSQRITNEKYLGKMIFHGDTWDYSTDTIEYNEHIKIIDTIHVSFENPDGSEYNPSDWILKCKLYGTMDKMCLTKDDHIEKYKRPKPVEIIRNNPVLLFATVFLVLGLILLMFKKPTGVIKP